MSKLIISEQIRDFFNWCDDNPGFSNPELYAAFPDEKKSSLRSRKTKWARYKKEGRWPERDQPGASIQIEPAPTEVKPDSESIVSSIHTSTQTEEPEQTDTFQPSPAEIPVNKQFIDESTISSKDTFISELFEKRETIMKILSDYDQTGALSMVEMRLEKPFKTASFSLMERTLEDFIQACTVIGISQRKAVHIALNDFIQKYSNESNQGGNK
jgi:hypothetical protein